MDSVHEKRVKTIKKCASRSNACMDYENFTSEIIEEVSK